MTNIQFLVIPNVNSLVSNLEIFSFLSSISGVIGFHAGFPIQKFDKIRSIYLLLDHNASTREVA